MTIVDCGSVLLHPVSPPNQEYTDVLAYQEPERDPSKTGNKPKQLVAVEVYGYEVGRGMRKRVVTPQEVFKLAALGCTDKEIAIWFDVAYETLRYNFSDIIAKGRQEMKTALRNAMFKNALSGNAALQIFLAKNLLGMSDNPSNSDETKILPWTDDEWQFTKIFATRTQMKYQILQGDNRDTLKTLADNSIDAIVTDPPFGIDFLG